MMDFRKVVFIASKDVRKLFSDRAALLFVIAAPLAITIIMGLVFGGDSAAGTAMHDIPVILVNHDQGNGFVNFGQVLTDSFLRPPEALKGLVKAEESRDENAAKEQVRQGKAAAAIFIPTGFSQALNPLNPKFGETKISLQLYRDAGSPISADIIVSVVRQFLNESANATIAIYAAGRVNPTLLVQSVPIAQDVLQASSQRMIQIQDNTNTSAGTQGSNLLGYFAPSIAIFFLNLSMSVGALSILEEQEKGTLQRLLATATTRPTILAGKLFGTYLSGVLQMLLLIVATTLIGPLMGNTLPVWGTNYPAVIALVLIVVAGSAGFGTLIAGMAKTSQEAGLYGSMIGVLMGIAGGTFMMVPDSGLFGFLSKLTINYWATNSFYRLEQTGDLLSVLPNLAILLVIFIVCFGIGVILFNRRLNV